MKEEFLYFLWKYKLFSTTDLKSTKGESIEIVNSGIYNTNTGPDFLNTQLKIDGQLWIGNIEIHLKSSDWYAHHHEEDTNYDAIILHVVWSYDADVFMKNNLPLPTLELEKFVSKRSIGKLSEIIFKRTTMDSL